MTSAAYHISVDGEETMVDFTSSLPTGDISDGVVMIVVLFVTASESCFGTVLIADFHHL